MPEGIDQSLVDEVWRALNDYDQVQAQGEARAFIRNQPHVAAFLRELTEEFDQEVQKAALGLVFLLFKVVEAHRGTPPGPISRERIQGAYDAATTWMERWDGATERLFIRGLGTSGEFPVPHLVQYVLQTFYAGDSGAHEYDQEVRGSLFLILKTVADALSL